MKREPTSSEQTGDLAALAAAAQGTSGSAVAHPGQDAFDESREKRIAELRAKYQAGELSIDGPEVASSLIDAHMDKSSD